MTIVVETALDPSIKHLAPTLSRFFHAMAYKLAENAHKGRWNGHDLERTLVLLRDEVEELKEAIELRNPIEVLLESADVANFAMIAAAIAIEGETDAEG